MECWNCGVPIDQKKRSNPDHRRLMALIHKALHHWPEQHRFRPVNFEHLRLWLICRAGGEWQEVETTLYPEKTETLDALLERTKHILRNDKGRFVLIHGNAVVVVVPKSMSFAAMGQSAFARLRDAITDAIEQEIGCTADQLLQEAA